MTSFNLFTFFQSEVEDSFQLASDWIIHVNLQERIIFDANKSRAITLLGF